jgi:hypothetical protein
MQPPPFELYGGGQEEVMRPRTSLAWIVAASLGSVACTIERSTPPEPPPAEDALPASVIITSPTGLGSWATRQGSVSLAGVTLGDITQLEWSKTSGERGAVDGTSEWVAIDIPLALGKNIITVSAPGRASESIIVLRNKSVGFVGLPELDKPGALLGSSTPVRVTVEMDPTSVFDAATVRLMREKGGVSKVATALYDDGDLAHGDEIAGDSIFSAIMNVDETSVGPITLYGAADAPTVGTETGPATTLAVVEPLSQAQLQKVRDLQGSAHLAYQTAIAGGANSSAALDAAVTALATDPEVISVARSDRSAMAIYRSGVIGALNFGSADERGGYGIRDIRDASLPRTRIALEEPPPIYPLALTEEELVPGNNHAFLMSPWLTDFGASDDNPWLAGRLPTTACPRYQVGAKYNNFAATFDAMLGVADYGLVSISTHGDTFVESKLKETQLLPEVLVKMEMLGLQTNAANTRDMLWLRGGVDDANLSRPEVMVALLTGALVMDSQDLGVTARFFRFYAGTFKDSFVNLGACRSLRNGDIAKAILAKGAKAVMGYSDYVNSGWAQSKVQGLLECLFTGNGLAADKKWTVANCYQKDKETDADPAEFRVVPSNSQLQLKTGFRNGSFERGKIGWFGTGDARVLPKLGGYSPTDGTRVGIISTGLGYTDSSGTFAQTFCIPEGTKKLSFDWNFISAEFMSYCGTQYQDSFVVSITDVTGTPTTLHQRKIDDLCGSVSKSSATIPQAGDPDGTYATGWRSAIDLDVSKWAGSNKDVTLSFSATDVGDSIYDSAILIDRVKLGP